MLCTIIFTNLHGLHGQLPALERLLTDGTADIVGVAETWFQNEAEMRASPFFIEHSIQFRRSYQGHQHGGCALFARPALHRRIRAYRGFDAVHFTFAGLKLCVAYLPPISLHDAEVPQRLTTFGDVDILVGDINAQRGVNNPRTRMIERWAREGSLFWMIPDGGPISRWDHLLAQPGKVLDYTMVAQTALGIRSDHAQAVRFTVSGNKPRTRGIPEGSRSWRDTILRRYDFRALALQDTKQRKAVHRHLRDQYHARAMAIRLALMFYDDQSKKLATRARAGERLQLLPLTGIADAVDALLVAHLQALADGLFRFERHKPRPQVWEPNPVRRFTRMDTAIKVQNKAKIVANAAAGDVMAEAETRFRTLWTASPSHNTRAETSPTYVAPPEEWVTRITAYVVRGCLSRYDPHTCSGTDGLSVVLLKALRYTEFAHHLTTAFQIYLRLTCSPARWNESLTVLIPKDKGRTCAVGRTRPISISGMFRRLFETVMLPTLRDHPQLTLHPAQTGFQKGKSTAINVALLHSDLQDKEMRVVFLDLADCYDRLSFEYQQQVWKQRKVEPYLRNLMTAMTQRDMSTVLYVEGKKSQRIQRYRGLPQGSVWSPFLYNVAANEMVRMVRRTAASDARAQNKRAVQRPIGLFADDTSLQARTDDDVERLVATVFEWCAAADMKIAWNKCSALGTDRDIEGPDGNVIRVEEQARYLGVDFKVDAAGRGIDWGAFYDRKLPRATRMTHYVSSIASSWHPRDRLTLIRTFVRPIVEYMAGLFFWIALEAAALSRKRLLNRVAANTVADALQRSAEYGPYWAGLQAIWTLWMRFIMGSRTAPPSAPGLTGIEEPATRFTELGVLLWNQLRGITSVPGLPTALNRIGIKFWGTEPPGSHAAWKERLRKERIARLQKIYGPCAERVTADARSASGVDRVFSVRCADLCMSLLRWRQGKWGFKRFMLCVCGAAYNFGHFRSCARVIPSVTAVGVERLFTGAHLDEPYMKRILQGWEDQLAATEGQTADESQLRPSTKKHPRPTPKSRRPEPSKDPPQDARMTRSSAALHAAS